MTQSVAGRMGLLDRYLTLWNFRAMLGGVMLVNTLSG